VVSRSSIGIDERERSVLGMDALARTFMIWVSALTLLSAATAPAMAAPTRSVASATSTSSALSPSWRFTPTATTNTLIVVDVVDRAVVWAAGGGFGGATNDGTVVRTVDGGRTWQNVTPPDGAPQTFRDVEAFDRNHALVLAAGEGDASRIYRTANGGATWELVFRNPDPNAFYDCMAFFDERRGLAVSDPVNGKFPILATADGGRTWQLTPSSGMPDALPNEYGRATGTCLVTAGSHDAWFGTNPELAPNARVFHTQDAGRTWTVAPTPIPGGPAGIVSLSFRDRRHGLAVGGDPPPNGADVGVVARTSDGGRTWSLGGAPAGYRNSVAWIRGIKKRAVVVGQSGSDLSMNGGRTWTRFDRTLLLGVDCAPHVVCWAVGERGLAAKLRL
jgi:photosystem II stability/assembly factor-like uncharacterized protein